MGRPSSPGAFANFIEYNESSSSVTVILLFNFCCCSLLSPVAQYHSGIAECHSPQVAKICIDHCNVPKRVSSYLQAYKLPFLC